MKDLEQSKSFFFGRLEFHNGVGTVCDLQGIQNLKKNHHHCWTQRRRKNHICP
jgi:hypothetical protein